MGDQGHILQCTGKQAERSGAKNCADYIRSGDGPRGRHEDQGEIGCGDERNKHLDREDVVLGSVHEWRHDGGGYKADEDQQATRDACFGFGEAVGFHDLVDEGGRGVKKPYVDGEREEDEVEGSVPGQVVQERPTEVELLFGRDGGRGGGRCFRDEGRREGDNSGKDGGVQNHVGDAIATAGGPQGTNQLAQRGAERVGERGDGGGGDAPGVGEPEVGVARRGGEDEGLGEADQDLAQHDHAEMAVRASHGAGIADPVADEGQRAGDEDGLPRPVPVEGPDDEGGDGHEGEQEGGAEPVDVGLRDGEVAR